MSLFIIKQKSAIFYLLTKYHSTSKHCMQVASQPSGMTALILNTGGHVCRVNISSHFQPCQVEWRVPQLSVCPARSPLCMGTWGPHRRQRQGESSHLHEHRPAGCADHFIECWYIPHISWLFPIIPIFL